MVKKGYLRIAAGGAVVWALAFALTPALGYRPTPYALGYEERRSDLPRYEAYAPLNTRESKHFVIGSCEISLPHIGNDLSDPNRQVRAGASALFGNVASSLMRNEYVPREEVKFYDVSAPNTGMADHTLFLFHALQAPNVKSVVYINALGLSHFKSFKPWRTLELMSVLEKFMVRYPGAGHEIAAYRRLLVKAPVYRKAIERFGQDWRHLIDPETYVFTGKTNVGPPLFSKAGAQLLASQMKQVLGGYLSGLTEALLYPLEVVADMRYGARDLVLRENLDWVASQYGRPEHEVAVTVQRGGNYLLNPDTVEENRVWLRMTAAVVREYGAKLVIYAQPMLRILPEDHRRSFRPKYLEPIRDWLTSYEPVIIDHTTDHPLTQQDFVQICDKGVCKSTGYYVNLVGRLKQARLLINTMIDAGIIDAGKRKDSVFWQGERDLPLTKRCIQVFGETSKPCVDWPTNGQVQQPATWK